MLHNEARELLVKGYEKTHNAKMIAQAYGVSEPTVYRLAQQKRETGCVTLRTHQRGRKALLHEEEKKQIRECIKKAPDITIAEIRDKLKLPVSESTIRRAVIAMGYRFKKKSLHATERDRPRCDRKTYAVASANHL